MAKRKLINEKTFNKIRSLLDYGITQKQIADIIGCSQVTVHRIKKSGAKSYEEWRAEARARDQAYHKKVLESQAGAKKAASEQTISEESRHDIKVHNITVEQNDTADAIRELTSVMRELVAAWEGNQTKKRRLF